MITATLISTFLSFSLLSSTEAVDELRRDYGEVRGTLQAYHGLLRDRIDPSPALALSNTLLSTGFIAGIHSESRETSNVVLFSEGASGLASLAQLGIGIWMPRSDVKVGALKFSEFYTWGFRAVGQFFYGRQLLEAGLNQEDPIKGRRLEERGSLHQNLGWFTALWGFQSTSYAPGIAMLNLKPNYNASTKRPRQALTTCAQRSPMHKRSPPGSGSSSSMT